MNKNEILQLLDNIIECGENMAKLGRALKSALPEMNDAGPKKPLKNEAEETDTTAAVTQETADSEKTYTFADVRKAFSAKSHAGYTAQVKELISKYGASRLSDVEESDYPALMADLEVIE